MKYLKLNTRESLFNFNKGLCYTLMLIFAVTLVTFIAKVYLHHVGFEKFYGSIMLVSAILMLVHAAINDLMLKNKL